MSNSLLDFEYPSLIFESNSDKVGNYYNELMLANEDLISGFKIRTQNFDEIQKHLAAINDLLYKATRLRGTF